jgi:hypothetical protein
MRIYITNILPSSLKHKLTNLEQFITKSFIRNEIVSHDYGIHIIENNNIYRIEPNFNPDIHIIKKFLNNELLIDNTDYKMLPVMSQMPINYVLTKMTIYEYQLDKKSKLKMVVECLDEPISSDIFFNQYKQSSTNMIPINFYFIYDNKNIDLTDQFLKEEFNVFLSHLN